MLGKSGLTTAGWTLLLKNITTTCKVISYFYVWRQTFCNGLKALSNNVIKNKKVHLNVM